MSLQNRFSQSVAALLVVCLMVPTTAMAKLASTENLPPMRFASGEIGSQWIDASRESAAEYDDCTSGELVAGERFYAESTFTYLRARWMDPRVGRFVSIDPFAGVDTKPLTLHDYAYANADPVNNIDPLGLMSLGEIGSGLNIQSTLRTAMPTVSKNALEIARKTKIFDIYDYAMWPLHFYMYAERRATATGIRYDVGNTVGWGGVLRQRNPFGILPGGYVRASPVLNRQGIEGKGIKVASHTFGQWLSWHVTVVGTEEASCKVGLPYSLTPGLGSNCLSWTVWATTKAIAASRLPL